MSGQPSTMAESLKRQRDELANALPELRADHKRKEDVYRRHANVSMRAYEAIQEAEARIEQMDAAIAALEKLGTP